MSFEKNVFINCPFDKQYKPLLNSILFTVLYFELNPQISENTSSSEVRIEKIKNLIKTSKYAIHDISRSEPLKEGDLPRFNMPYEMGLDIGCQAFGGGKLKTKKCLILDKERYKYLQIVSDIGGQDIKDHDNDPQKLIAKLREWFSSVLQNHLPSPSVIWDNYLEFSIDVEEQLLNEGWTIDDIGNLPYSNYIKLANAWIIKKG